MSSEKLGSAKELLKGNLGGSWDILEGSEGNYTDLGIARRFGGAAAAYSLRDIGAMNGSVVRVRRSPEDTTDAIDDEERFSANQVQDGTLERWVNGELESTLPADVDTAAAAYSLRKVKASYGIPNTVVNGTENFPATVPSSGSPADIGNGFTAHKFSDGVADSESVTVSGGTITVTAIASGTGSFSAGCRLKGLADGKQYTVSGEFRVTSQGADGGGVALVDISDDTAGTDEDSITTSSTTFTPFFIDAGYNGGGSENFVDLQANSSGSNSGTLTAEFRNIKIIENNNSAVRIRRSSDGEEVVVGFDADNKVSASSPVTATPSGSTTATSVAEFLSEERTTFITNPVMSTVSGDVTVLSNDTSSTEFTFTFSGSTGDGFVRHNGKPNNLGADIGDTVSFDITASGLSQQCGVRARKTGANNDAISPGINNIDNGTQTITFTVTTNGPVGYFCFVNLGSASTGTIRVHNLKVVGKSATVHTWYDQAGSNNAVQETAGNQPKIAENGALLADGIKFDGDNDALNFTDLTLTNASIFTVLDIDGTENLQIILGGSTTTATATMIPMMQTSSTTTQVYKNATVGGAEQGSSQFRNASQITLANRNDAYSELATKDKILFTMMDVDVAADKVLDGISQVPSDATTWGLKGTMEELIIYNSDQSDNRFKIESNINNYYGLYNDANDVTGAFTSSGAQDFTANGTDGFTLTNSTSTAFGGIELNQVLADGEKIYISFNLSIDAGANTSPNLNIREGSIIGSTASDEGFFEPTEGFNSTVFTSDAGGDARYISFGENNADPSTYTISDFKVSRIARNGFVETWYDQSGNGNDADQTNDTKQPAIVQNGNLVKVGNKASIKFDGSNDFLERANYTQGDLSQPNTAFTVAKLRVFVDDNQKIFDGHFSAKRNMIQLNTAGNGQFAAYAGTVQAAGEDADADQHLFESRFNGVVSRFIIDGVIKTTNSQGTQSMQGINLGANHDSASNFWDGDIQEVIIYNSDHFHNRLAIEANINNQYQIY